MLTCSPFSQPHDLKFSIERRTRNQRSSLPSQFAPPSTPPPAAGASAGVDAWTLRTCSSAPLRSPWRDRHLQSPDAPHRRPSSIAIRAASQLELPAAVASASSAARGDELPDELPESAANRARRRPPTHPHQNLQPCTCNTALYFCMVFSHDLIFGICVVIHPFHNAKLSNIGHIYINVNESINIYL